GLRRTPTVGDGTPAATMRREPRPLIPIASRHTIPKSPGRARVIVNSFISACLMREAPERIAGFVPGVTRLFGPEGGGYNALCMKTVAERGNAGWKHETSEPTLKKSPERAASFTTISGRPIDRLYTAEDVEGIDYARDVNNPGAFPYTRGIHPTGYRGKLWTMRQFAGFGTPEDTNARYKTLLGAGGTGLSVAFDLPTLMGRDPDHELSLGE